MSSTHRLRVVTYNTHKSRGLDGRIRPRRIVNVLREINADIICLQEVLSIPDRSREKDQARYFSEELEMNLVVGETRKLKGGVYGNVILTRLPILFHRTYDISVWWREEQRGCLRADVQLNEQTIAHIFNVHMGTEYVERRHQARKLIDNAILHNEELRGLRVVMGDFNEWTLGLATQLLGKHFKCADSGNSFRRRSKTFPVVLPVLALDHIYFDAAFELEKFSVYRSPAALVASDHFPVIADLELHAPPVL